MVGLDVHVVAEPLELRENDFQGRAAERADEHARGTIDDVRHDVLRNECVEPLTIQESDAREVKEKVITAADRSGVGSDVQDPVCREKQDLFVRDGWRS